MPPTPEVRREKQPIRSGLVGAWIILGAIVVAVPFLIYGLLNTTTSSSDVYPWFPDGTEERANYQLYDEIFGPEDYWIVCTDSASNSELIDEIEKAVREANQKADPPLLRRIKKSSSFLKGLDNETKVENTDKLKGIFFDRNGTRGIVFAEATEYGFRNRKEVYEEIFEPIVAQFEPDEKLHVIGPGFMGVMADRETKDTLVNVTPFTFLLSSILAFLVLGNVRFTLIALATSGLAAVGSIAMVYYTGNALSHLLTVIPSLAQLLALSNAIHLIQYYCDAEANPNDVPSWKRAFREGWKPTVAASITTVIGFLSLHTSSLPVVRSFSTFGSLSVLLTMCIVLLVVPTGLILLRPWRPKHDWIHTSIIPRLDRGVGRFRTPISFALLAVLVTCFFGFGNLKTEIRTETFFSDESELQQSFQWFDKVFGSLQASQLIGTFEEGIPIEKQYEVVRDLETKLKEEAKDIKVYSPVTMMLGDNAGLVPISTLEETLREERLLQTRDGLNYWIVTVYHEPIEEMANSPIDTEIEAQIEAVEKYHPEGSWFVTGTYRLFGNAQELLVSELLRTFTLAFLLITPCIILFLRNIKLGLVATIANIFPIAVFFGSLGFLGIKVDIATMVIASIAFGIAVDDTIHFLNSFTHDKYRKDHSIHGIVSEAFSKSGAAIIKTTLIIAGGMLAFLLSDFGPSRRFAMFTSVVLILAAIGDLILLPALFRGPFSRFVRK